MKGLETSWHQGRVPDSSIAGIMISPWIVRTRFRPCGQSPTVRVPFIPLHPDEADDRQINFSKPTLNIPVLTLSFPRQSKQLAQAHDRWMGRR